MSTPPPLASLHVGVLDRDQVLALCRDLEATATVRSVRAKLGPRDRAPPGVLELNEGIALILAGSVCGLQIRYGFEDQTWCDTLVASGAGAFRLVRMAEG